MSGQNGHNRIAEHVNGNEGHEKPKKKKITSKRHKLYKSKKFKLLSQEIIAEGKDPSDPSKLLSRLAQDGISVYRQKCEKSDDLESFFPYRKLWSRYLTTASGNPLGNNGIILLCFLANEARRYKAEIKNNGWFYSTEANMFEETGIPGRTQRRIIETLTEAHYIEFVTRGVPQIRYFRINWELIDAMVMEMEKLEERLNCKKRR